jgi:hypothetical protein
MEPAKVKQLVGKRIMGNSQVPRVCSKMQDHHRAFLRVSKPVEAVGMTAMF